jgi:hypothetical protein
MSDEPKRMNHREHKERKVIFSRKARKKIPIPIFKKHGGQTEDCPYKI